MPTPFTPPHGEPEHAGAHLRERGYTVLAPRGLATLMGEADASDPLAALAPFWSDLPIDAHLRDGGAYRFRRHGSFVVEGGELRGVEHRAHWQPLDYNALHGGIERMFEPLAPALVADPLWARLLLALTERASELRGTTGPWFVEAHAFRITTGDGIGRPTPEGAHRDGVDQVAVILMAREGIVGGETRVFEANGPNGQRFTMTERGTTLLIDDARAIHETTPIQPLEPNGAGHRDTLVLTWRLGGFQEP
ncbi:hypothetical protein Pla163_01900 [Planctomycetes bacterium Pla163]|jgi:hypothetical protein|uniref:2OG-Fe dioxygenase family protein n=1 Tax=Rohdeia mirabilis TaxID=2528008 RepID=A0A518CV69_9BACT|nr:hypothetical protein Pla163_01900 [Planctomycetes bacterium Pla163]